MHRLLFPFRTKSNVEDHLPDCLLAETDKSDQDSFPDAKEDSEYTRDLDVMKMPTVLLKGITMQCIAKLGNIVLTPKKPKHPGGKCYIEGEWVITPALSDRSYSLALRRDGKRHIISSVINVSPPLKQNPVPRCLFRSQYPDCKTTLRPAFGRLTCKPSQDASTVCMSSTRWVGKFISRRTCL